jgi:hypothetical protein
VRDVRPGLAVRFALVDLTELGAFSDIQESRPQPLADLERSAHRA